MKKTMFILMGVMMLSVLFNSCRPDDRKTQIAVQTAINDQAPIMVQASVKNGIVTLAGKAHTEEQRVQVEDIAKSVKNVERVVNEIVVEAPAPPVNPDDTLKATITKALTDAGYGDVGLEVKDGEVTLTGKAKKADIGKIESIVNALNPKTLTNKLNK